MDAKSILLEGKVVTILLLSQIVRHPVEIDPWVVVLLSDQEFSHSQARVVEGRGPVPDLISLKIKREKFSGQPDFPIPSRLQVQYYPPGELVIDLSSNWNEEGLQRFLERTRDLGCFAVGFGYTGQDRQGRQAYSVRPWVVMGPLTAVHDQEGNQSA